MSLNKIRHVLNATFPQRLVEDLVDSYQEQKRNFFLGNHRPTEVEGGRFSEASFRLLEYKTTGTFTPIGTQLNTDGLINQFKNLSQVLYSDSIRLHIPRTLRVIYDIRNKRDVAHLADGIDPNLQDASFVFAALDWVLAEFVRISGSISADAAFALVKVITIHAIPAIEDFDGFLKTLKPSLGPSDRVLLLLYHRGNFGATINELSGWLKPGQRKNLKRTLTLMEYEKDLIVSISDKKKITRLGILDIQNRRLLEL
ncbi:MAG TPA: hypothetical protein VFE32_14875 [Puia sp.]|nr:hypothetical protein [Puia sp.]